MSNSPCFLASQILSRAVRWTFCICFLLPKNEKKRDYSWSLRNLLWSAYIGFYIVTCIDRTVVALLAIDNCEALPRLLVKPTESSGINQSHINHRRRSDARPAQPRDHRDDLTLIDRLLNSKHVQNHSHKQQASSAQLVQATSNPYERWGIHGQGESEVFQHSRSWSWRTVRPQWSWGGRFWYLHEQLFPSLNNSICLVVVTHSTIRVFTWTPLIFSKTTIILPRVAWNT